MCLSDKSHGPLQLLEVAPLASRTFSGFRATSSSRAVGALVVARERWLLVLLELVSDDSALLCSRDKKDKKTD